MFDTVNAAVQHKYNAMKINGGTKNITYDINTMKVRKIVKLVWECSKTM